MKILTYSLRSAAYFRSNNLALVLATAVGSATICGALFVGDSIRGSLRENALQRLGPITHAMVAPRRFSDTLASRLQEAVPNAKGAFLCSALMVQGSIVHADTGRLAGKVQFWGVDDAAFAWFQSHSIRDHERDNSKPSNQSPPSANGSFINPRSIILNDSLRKEIGVVPGDDVILRFGAESSISTETLFGRRDRSLVSARWTVASFLAPDDLQELSLRPSLSPVLNAFVPREALQRLCAQQGRANIVLAAMPQSALSESSLVMETALRNSLTLDDFGLTIRQNTGAGYAALESDRFLLEPSVEAAAQVAIRSRELHSVSILTYLANAMSALPKDGTTQQRSEGAAAGSPTSRFIPYSTVSAILVNPGASDQVDITKVLATPATSSLHLSQWAATRLSAALGDDMELSYYVTSRGGSLREERSTLKISSIAPIGLPYSDPGFTPNYPGVTDSKAISDWDPPFPMDLKLITPDDEKYWEEFGAAPKAWIHLSDGQRFWAHDAERFGRLTSIRVYPSGDQSLEAVAEEFGRELRNTLASANVGFQFDAVRANAIHSSSGATDFSVLFLAFGGMTIFSAAILVNLVFRLRTENRVKEIGLLSAMGVAPRRIMTLLLTEGAIIALAGSVMGIPLGLAYSATLISFLEGRWSSAIHRAPLTLSATWTSVSTGTAAGWLLAMIGIWWVARSCGRRSCIELLSGFAPQRNGASVNRFRLVRIVSYVSFALFLFCAIFSRSAGATAQAGLFFLSGASLLASMLCVVRIALGPPKRMSDGGRLAGGAPRRTSHRRFLIDQSIASLRRNPSRTMGVVILTACAAFLIASLQAFQIDPTADSSSRNGGSGGFPIMATASSPILLDLNRSEVRAQLGFGEFEVFRNAKFFPFRVHPGDEASCVGMYRPTHPRIIGASPEFVQRGGFRFASSLSSVASNPTDPINPKSPSNQWELLTEPRPDGAIAAIADEAAVRWQLHLGLGQSLMIEDESGNPRALQFVGLLSGSALQGEMIISEENFVRLFPSSAGHSFFLIDGPNVSPQSAIAPLETSLAEFGVDAFPTMDRLIVYAGVQNTYLSAFQTLGGLGLLLGAAGIGIVAMRNVLERRKELGLLAAIGFPPFRLAASVFLETLILVGLGVVCGAASSVVIVLPLLYRDGFTYPVGEVSAILFSVLAVGLVSGLGAAGWVNRMPILQSLRSE